MYVIACIKSYGTTWKSWFFCVHVRTGFDTVDSQGTRLAVISLSLSSQSRQEVLRWGREGFPALWLILLLPDSQCRFFILGWQLLEVSSFPMFKTQFSSLLQYAFLQAENGSLWVFPAPCTSGWQPWYIGVCSWSLINILIRLSFGRQWLDLLIRQSN